MASSINAPLHAIVFCGPSGVGKGTLLGRLMQTYPTRFGYSISHTTRAPRPGEENHREYHFVDRPTMERLSSEGAFLELCDVHGNLYGTSVEAVSTVHNSGKLCVIEIDIQGVQKIREGNSQLNLLCVFIKPPSIDDLRERIRNRGAEMEEVIERRLRTAETEMQFWNDHPDFFHYTICNENLDQAYETLLDLLRIEFKKRGMQNFDDGKSD